MTQDRDARRPRRETTGSTPGETRHRWVIDKLEEGTASVEHDGDRVYPVPRSMIPAAAREGDVLDVRVKTDTDAGGDVVTVALRVDRAGTQAAIQASAEQVARIPHGDDPGGDIKL
jgi:hypothetical protein